MYDVDGLTIDLGGRTLKVDDLDMILQGVGFTVRNGTMVAGDETTYPLFIGDEGLTEDVILQDLVLDGGVNIFNAHGVVLRNVTSHGTNYYAVWCDENSGVVIESGTYDTEGKESGSVLGGSLKMSTLRVEGGTYTIAEGQTLVLDGKMAPTIQKGTFKGDGATAEEINEYATEGFKVVGDSKSGFVAVAESDVESEEISGKTSVEVESGDLTLKVDGLVDGSLDIAVQETEVSEIQGYGTPVAVYDVIVSGSAWTGEGTITVTVRLAVPDGYRVDSGSVKVLYIPDEGEPEDMGATLGRDGSTVSFSTDHNSEYAVFYDTGAAQKFAPVPENRDEVPVVIPNVSEDDPNDYSTVACVIAGIVVTILAIAILASRHER